MARIGRVDAALDLGLAERSLSAHGRGAMAAGAPSPV